MPPICIHCNSQSAIGKVQNSIFNDKFTYICHRHNTIRHLRSIGVISLDYVRSTDNIADLLTKGVKLGKIRIF